MASTLTTTVSRMSRTSCYIGGFIPLGLHHMKVFQGNMMRQEADSMASIPMCYQGTQKEEIAMSLNFSGGKEGNCYSRSSLTGGEIPID